LPGMALSAALVYGQELLTRRRDLALSIVACCGAPFMLLALNRLVTPPGISASQSLPGVSFVGDFLFSSDQILHPTLKSWSLLFNMSDFGVVLPALVLGCTCVLIGRHFLGESSSTRFALERKRAVTALLLLYWLPVAAVATLATAQSERYLLHIHPIGLALMVLLAYDLIAHPFPMMPSVSAGARPSSMHSTAVGPRRRTAPQAWRPELDRFGARLPARTIVDSLPAWLSARSIAMAGFAVVVIIGAVLRINHVNRLSLWFDEGLTVLYSKQPWASVAGFHGFYSPHPPLYFTFVKVGDLYVGNEMAGRLISVIAGIATIPLFYLLIARVLDHTAAFVASLALALSPIHLYYSQEARMYALVVFFLTVTFLALVSYNERPGWRWAAIYGVSAALALWVDYSAVFVLAPQTAFIAVQFARRRRQTTPLMVAAVLAVVAFLPWIPQVLDSVKAADLVENTDSYLAVDHTRVTTVMLSLIGYGGDDSYFQSFRGTLWTRWPVFRPILLIALLPLIVLGVKGLWRRWEAMLVVGGLMSTMLIAIWVSQVSPGFAERTVITTMLGWSALLGAAFSAKSSRLMKSVTVACLAVVLIVQSTTIGILYDSSAKEEWRSVSDDVATVSTLNFPLITYSYAGAADTLLSVYHPEIIQSNRVITVRDGVLDRELTNGVIPEVGLSRTFDIPAGRLEESLPRTPDNDLVWYLYYPREGEGDVRGAIERAGYTRVMHNEYSTPRSQLYLDLYARPDAQMGTLIPIDDSFDDQEGGWTLPDDGGTVTPGSASVPAELTIANQASTGREAFALIDLTGQPALATFAVDLKTGIPTSGIDVIVSCLSSAGTILSTQGAEIQQQTAAGDLWRTAEVTAFCPVDAATVRLSLQNHGQGDVTFRNPTLRVLVVPVQAT
jgi:mannosyltransferase